MAFDKWEIADLGGWLTRVWLSFSVFELDVGVEVSGF
jgi:hypothetical protein